MTMELKPCPFCGTPPTVCDDDSYGGCHVGCQTCDIVPDQCSLTKGLLPQAIAAWNARATLTPAADVQDRAETLRAIWAQIYAATKDGPINDGNDKINLCNRILDVATGYADAATPAADVEGRARELLAAEFDRSGLARSAEDVLRGKAPGFSTPPHMDEAIRAISAALRTADAPSDEGRDTGRDEGATFVLENLAQQLGVSDYQQCDGTEEWEGDVSGTVYNILVAAKVIDDKTGAIARIEAMGGEAAADAQVQAVDHRQFETEFRKWLPLVWTNFLDANPDEITSPEEFPDHALMTGAQFEEWALDAFVSARSQVGEADAQGGADREAIARIVAGDIYGDRGRPVGPATMMEREKGLSKADAILALWAGGKR